MTTVPSRQGSRGGFTILELMTVCLIIVVLMGILFPVIKKVKTASQIADTQQEISQLTNAITQYFNDFHAYPGPFPNIGNQKGVVTNFADGATPSPNNVDIEGGNTTPYTNPKISPNDLTGVPLEIFTPLPAPGAWSTSPVTTTYQITSSENLVLGLLGGLNYDPATGLLGFNPTEVGLGPLNLNYNATSKSFISPQRYSPYLQGTNSSNGYLMWCGSVNGTPIRTAQYQTSLVPQPFFDEANNPAFDSPIPEFVDRFPSPGPLPILYLRAHTGVTGIVSDDTTKDPIAGTTTEIYHYDIRDITPYTLSAIGMPPLSPGQPQPTHNLIPNLTTTPDIPFLNQFIAKAGVMSHPDVGPYFESQTMQPTNVTTDAYFNNTGRPRSVDSYILISAGPDGIYGTGDDITSFGDVMP